MSQESDAPRRRGPFGWIAAILCWLLLLSLAAVVAGWMGGDVRTWSLLLSWVPAVALLPVIVIGLLLVGFVRGGMGTFLWRAFALCLAFVLAWILGTELGLFRAGDEEPSDFVVAHWNASWPSKYQSLDSAYSALTDTNADLIVITEPGQFGWGEDGQAFQRQWPYSARPHNALLLSRVPFSQVHPVLSADGIDLVLVKLNIDDRPATIWVVDLPSDPTRLRSKVFSTLKEKAQAAGISAPDLILGDLNVTRHSRALEHAFPKFRNAFDEGGVGWSGTWWRDFPLWHLDQILVSPSMRSIRYEVLNPGVGDHRIQRAALRWNTRNPQR